MRIITFNVNGLRSSAKKGFYQWLSQQDADVVCLQEIRVDHAYLDKERHTFFPDQYFHFYNPAQKKGYSGVAIYTRQEPTKVQTLLGFPLADDEGRYVHIELGPLLIASIYFPSGTSGEVRQKLKYEFLDQYGEIMQKQLLHPDRFYILCGDWNIAHKQIDLKNWKSNQDKTGFLPEERAWLDTVVEWGYVDAFRVLNPNPGEYTWWSQRAGARKNNVGWRIDYQFVSPNVSKHIKQVSIYRDEIFSDHAPLIIDYDF